MKPGEGGRPPDMKAIHAGNQNLRFHMQYIDYLAARRNWLAGDRISFADLAGAAHLSCIDYLGDVAWEEFPHAKTWYARIKSRPAFRPLLIDQVPGMPPSSTYVDLDF